MRSARFFGLGAILGLGLLACSTSADDADSSGADLSASPSAFDVNDVSILFPLGPDGMPRPNIAVDDPKAPLFGPGTFKTVTEFAQTGSEGFKNPDTDTNQEIVGKFPHVHISDGALDRKNWRIVAMRFDPCAPGALSLGFNDLRCVAEMRLVAQPFVDGKAQDVTAHLVFNLGFAVSNQALVGDAVARLQAIKASSKVPTTGEPLGPHPGLVAEAASGGGGGGGETGKLVQDFIATFAAKATDISLLGKTFSTAQVLAFMVKDGDFTTPADAPEWYFMAGNITNDAWTPSEITPVGKDVHFEKLSFKQKQGGEGEFEPTVDGQPAAVGGHFLPKFKAGGPDSEPLFLGDKNPMTVQSVEDPTGASIQRTDCVSCHTSTSRTIALDLPPAARQPTPAGITAVVRRENLQASTANVRNFGYFAGKPTVSMRTLTETAAVADFLDKSFLKSTGPSKVVVDDKLWTCCMKGGGDSCDGTVCAPSAKAHREVQLEPNGDGGNPCSPDTSDNENDPRSAMDVSSDGTTVTLHGNDAACLTLSMNGNFFSDEIAITCSQLDLCTIQQKKSGPIAGASAARLRNILYQGERGGGWTAQDGTHEVTMTCDQSCTLTIH